MGLTKKLFRYIPPCRIPDVLDIFFLSYIYSYTNQEEKHLEYSLLKSRGK